MLQSPITAAAADGPALILDSICTAEEPYAVNARVTDFPPSERFAVIAVLFDSDNRRDRSGTHFETDANGASGVGSVLATEPFDAVAIFYRDLNDNFRIDRGEDVVARFTATIDQPCEGLIAQPK